MILENQQVLRLALPSLQRVAIAPGLCFVTKPFVHDAKLYVLHLSLNIDVQFKVQMLSPAIVHSVTQGHVQRPVREMLLEVVQVAETAVCDVVGEFAAELMGSDNYNFCCTAFYAVFPISFWSQNLMMRPDPTRRQSRKSIPLPQARGL